jgi:hypothetical protein
MGNWADINIHAKISLVLGFRPADQVFARYKGTMIIWFDQ